MWIKRAFLILEGCCPPAGFAGDKLNELNPLEWEVLGDFGASLVLLLIRRNLDFERSPLGVTRSLWSNLCLPGEKREGMEWDKQVEVQTSPVG